MKTTPRSCCAALCFAVLGLPAVAQTGPELMLLPWQEGQAFQASARAISVSTETDPLGADIHFTRYDGSARLRLDPNSEADPTLGYEYTYFELSTGDPALPSRLTDTSIAFGGRLGATDFGMDHGDWEVAYTLGFGYAGDVPLHDGDAWYALGSVSAVRAIDRDTQWIVALQYDGNRVFLPDVPLPAVTYRGRYNAEVTYTLGFPFSSLTWRPDLNWTVTLRTLVLVNLNAEVAYKATDDLTFYAVYERDTDAFQLDGDLDTRRLIVSQQRVELGLRYRVDENLRLIAAGGFAFDQTFDRGFDTRDLRTVADLDDAAFFRVGVEVAF